MYIPILYFFFLVSLCRTSVLFAKVNVHRSSDRLQQMFHFFLTK